LLEEQKKAAKTPTDLYVPMPPPIIQRRIIKKPQQVSKYQKKQTKDQDQKQTKDQAPVEVNTKENLEDGEIEE
jgi:hypothetical protein